MNENEQVLPVEIGRNPVKGAHRMIYLDNAATTLHKSPQVGAAILAAMETMGNSARGSHAGSLDAAHTIYDCRCKLAALFHCPRPDRVVFTSNVTEALNMALWGLLQEGDHVVATDWDHNSILRPLHHISRERNVSVSFVHADGNGNLLYSDFEDLMQPSTRLIVCTHASNLTGNVLDVARVAEIAHRHGALLVLDAAQTAGSREVDMTAMGVDVLCFTGHKGLMGPQGTGGLCIAPGVEIRPYKVGGTGVQTYSEAQPAQLPVALEAGTLNGHGIAGLSAALDYIQQVGIDAIHDKEKSLTMRFYHGIRDIPGVRVYGDFSGEHSAIVTLNIRDYDSGAVADALWDNYEIAVRAGAHCAPRMHRALGTVDQGAVRFSFSWFTTEAEIDAAIHAVKALAEE